MSDKQIKKDRRLERAKKEIQATLEKYDLAAAVAISSDQAAEWFFRVDASWSIAYIEMWQDKQAMVKFRADKTNIPDPDKRLNAIDLTARMVASIRDICLIMAKNFSKMDHVMQSAITMMDEPLDIKPEQKQ
jgi:hypothetical protein